MNNLSFPRMAQFGFGAELANPNTGCIISVNWKSLRNLIRTVCVAIRFNVVCVRYGFALGGMFSHVV